MSEINADEKKLVKLAKEFIEFLESEPKIRFNLHRVLHLIRENFEFIQAKF